MMFDASDNLRLCKNCASYETTNPDGICWHCKEQDMIDDAIPPMKDFVCWGCGKEYYVDEEFCPECGGEIWTREELEGYQGVEDNE